MRYHEARKYEENVHRLNASGAEKSEMPISKNGHVREKNSDCSDRPNEVKVK